MKKNPTNHDELIDLFIGLSQATRCCRQNEAFCEGVTFQQFLVLDAIVKNKELNLSALHELLCTEKSTTTRLVGPLIKKGLVQRKSDQKDSRAVRLTLTQEGRKIYQKVRLCLMNFLQKILCQIPTSRQNEIMSTVKIFLTAIKNSAMEESCCK